MVEQQKRSLGLTAIAALSLAGWFALYGLLWYVQTPMFRSTCGPGDDLCGLELLGPAYLFAATGALIGFAAWLGATVRAIRQHEVLSALSIGLLLPVALVNATLVARHATYSVS